MGIVHMLLLVKLLSDELVLFYSVTLSQLFQVILDPLDTLLTLSDSITTKQPVLRFEILRLHLGIFYC